MSWLCPKQWGICSTIFSIRAILALSPSTRIELETDTDHTPRVVGGGRGTAFRHLYCWIHLEDPQISLIKQINITLTKTIIIHTNMEMKNYFCWPSSKIKAYCFIFSGYKETNFRYFPPSNFNGLFNNKMNKQDRIFLLPQRFLPLRTDYTPATEWLTNYVSRKQLVWSNTN